MSKQDLITIKDIARKLPEVVRKLPKMAYGLALGSSTNPTKAGGLGWAIEKATKANPYGSAVLYKDTNLNYLQFNQWANRVAHYFLAQGLKKGDVVAVFIENRPELLAVTTGLAKIGVISAMVNTSQTGKVLTHSINLVKPKMAIIGSELVESFSEVRADLNIPTDRVYWLADQDTLKDVGEAPDSFRNLAIELQSAPSYNPPTTNNVYYSDGLYYIYTSGTTGMPKAAIFSHGRWMKAYGVFGSVMDLKKNDIMYCTLPLYHATGMVVCWGAAIYGASGFAIRRKFSAREFWEDVRKFNASAIGYVGELCRYLMEVPVKAEDRAHRVTKMVGNGMRPNIWGPFKQRFGVDEVYELYASSEGNIGFNNIFNFDNTVGFSPLPYAIVKYDKENEKPVRDADGYMIKAAIGEPGLLVGKITERTPFDGYTDAAKNEACILHDVFEKGDRYFNTGDLVRNIGFRHAQFVDRLGDTFRWKGENVSTTEVENLVCSYPSIAEAVVYGVEIPNTNGRAGMAAITPHEGIDIDYAHLLEHLRREMPPYAVPVFLRQQQKMETTGTFKYQKNNLKKEGFDPHQSHKEPLYVWLPGTDSYQLLTPEIWENISNSAYRF
ncbi:MAG: long-chain-acyl-CoA synthetase [Fluviicoccus sp.]|uniref:long-chain-acyl-CoA synthetase n=1 Tax=Fluviicoccus sp. TaxID=2003552 RepID=UPI00271CA4D6|nr:long-chain-acyl-CoA synthetase [Fluviicoccus sp.]MDO8330167.1 long-chain-acyl-CoA synthetase [Fluviicoccus sp.]